MIKRLKERIKDKKRTNDEKVTAKDRRAESFRERVESQTEAITFAEAGLQEAAQEMIRADLGERAKILAVGHEHNFSKPLQDYALGFAERMGYEIVALNVGPVQTRSATLEPYCDMLCQQFKAKCEDGVREFRRTCEEKGIPFSHLVKFGDVDKCIKEVHEEYRRVEFVVTEPESCPEEGRMVVPVFCLAR